MKTLREYIDLIEAADSSWDKPVKSKMWAKNTLTSKNDDIKGSMQSVRYDQNAAGDHRFTTMSQTDDDDPADDSKFHQTVLPASSNLTWVTNEEESEETSDKAIDRVEQLQKR